MLDIKCCHNFFQISEFSLIKKLYRWRDKTGFALDTNNLDKNTNINSEISFQEEKTMNYMCRNISLFYSIMIEILWDFNGCNCKEFKLFIFDYNPDIVWL